MHQHNVNNTNQVMSSDNKFFLDLDIKNLFQEHNIKDVELIQKQIQHETDRKKIELRTLVGERYRDLIQAADTIAEMRQTTESANNKIANIEYTFRELQNKYLAGLTTRAATPHDPCSDTHLSSDSVIIQIKILMDVPEQIWCAIDSRNMLLATQLFLLARHVNYSLAFQVGGDIALDSNYPIVSKQWGMTSQFKNLLIGFCNRTLQSTDLSSIVAANCLAALVLLQGFNSLEVLDKLIAFRSQAVQSVITSDDGQSVKNKIKSCLNILMQVIPLVSACFSKSPEHRQHDEDGGLVLLYTNGIKDKNALDAILSTLSPDMDGDLLYKFLPHVAKNHKPFAVEEHRDAFQKLPIGCIRKTLIAWFDWLSEFSRNEIRKLFQLVTSVKGILAVRQDCLAVATALPPTDGWQTAWQSLDLQSVNFWIDFFQASMTERIKDLLNEQLHVCLVDLKRDFTELLTQVSSREFGAHPEHDLRWFVWRDSSSDLLPQSFIDNSCDNGRQHRRPLLMKARGFSPNIAKLCDDFESGLGQVLLHVFTTTDTVDNVMFVEYRDVIQDHLQSVITKLVDDFVDFAKRESLGAGTPKAAAAGGGHDVKAIVTARFLQALPLLCSRHFKECFTNLKWQEICDKLRQESCLAWSLWAKCFIASSTTAARNEYLAKETADEIRMHSIITDWERVTIEEEAEEGKRISSEILVPHQASVHLQRFLSFVCQQLNKAIPHTIPKTTMNEITDALAAELLDYYSRVCSLDIRQKQAIQMLFDCRFVSLLMVPRENEPLAQQSNKLCNAIISKIDPFDFDVLRPFIYANVKKAAQRSLLIYGNLIPGMEQLHSVLGARIDHHYKAPVGCKSIQDPPGILALCTGAPWFPSLAITAPGRSGGGQFQIPAKGVSSQATHNLERAQAQKKPAGKEQWRSDSASAAAAGSSIKSGAAAFFGAMGGEWFGGGGGTS